jgi:peptidoglycan/LPS O-acetylase OafA/YrhL
MMGNMQRKSNIELLRIIAMAGIIVLHYNNPSIGGGLAYSEGLNRIVLYFLESIFACAVDLFLIINGYFMCRNSKRIFMKPLELLVQVVVFAEGIYLLGILLGRKSFSMRSAIGVAIPANYFVILYITLYFISPIINCGLEKLSEKRSCRRAMLVLLVAFSIYPTLVDIAQEVSGRTFTGLSSVGMYGSQWGYSIVNFVLMYVIGAYIRETDAKKVKLSVRLSRMLFLAFVLTIWAFLNDLTGFGTERSAWEYCNPVIILFAIEVFELFRDFNIQMNSVINDLAKASFTVFLLHSRFIKFMRIEQFVKGNFFMMLVHIMISVCSVYLVCWCVYRIYEFIVRPFYNRLERAIPILTKNIYEGL